MISYPLPSLALAYGREDVKAALEPVVETVSNLDSLMFDVIGQTNTVYYRLRSVDRKVAMQFDHGVPRGRTSSDP